MGADSWTICPKCLINAREANAGAQARRQEKLDAAYGKVSAAEYLKLLEAPAPPEVEVEETFAEYLEAGLTKAGKFYIRYSGGCRKCKFKFDFAHEQQALK